MDQDPARRRLLLEEASGTALLNGAPADLPPREFKLLLELAKRPGEPVSGAELASAVWPDVTWDVSQELYVLMSRLRRLLGDEGPRLLKNRRGFGYYLALPEHDVVVAKTLEVVKARRLVDAPHPDLPRQPAAPLPPISRSGARRLRARRAAAAGTVAFGLVAGSSVGAVMLSAPHIPLRKTPAPEARVETEDQTASTLERWANLTRGTNEARRNTGGGGGTPHKSRTKPRRAGAAGVVTKFVPVALVRAAPEPDAKPPSEHGVAPSEPETQARQQPQRRPSQAQPAPTRLLYHMVNKSTGEHFMTIDPSLATDRQGRGYTGAPIGRVYAEAHDYTTRIATDHESAYIFNKAWVKTQPQSETTALWYATNGRGDSFYTTSQTEATQGEWSATLIGYIRTL